MVRLAGGMTTWLTGPEAVAELRAWCAIHGVPTSRLLKQAHVNRSLLTRWSRGSAPQRRVWDRITMAQREIEAPSLEELLGG